MFRRTWYKALPALLFLLALGGCGLLDGFDPLRGLGEALHNLFSNFKFNLP